MHTPRSHSSHVSHFRMDGVASPLVRWAGRTGQGERPVRVRLDGDVLRLTSRVGDMTNLGSRGALTADVGRL